MKHWKKIVLGIALLILLFGAGFVVWGSTPAGPMDEALAALQSDARVQVKTGDLLVFTPAGETPKTGLIFYPGGRVDYRSYAPLARAIAEQGYLVAIPKMPLSLAVMDPNAADGIIAAYPEVTAWTIGGHSLGGAMAAQYIRDHPDKIRGLFLEASYPPDSSDLSKLTLAVTSVYGTNDGVASLDEVKSSAARLPADTRWVAIDGGNHAGFGWYGPQSGDGSAAITRDAQQAQAVAAAVDLLERIEAKK